MAMQPNISTVPTPNSLAHSLKHLHEVFTRPDLQAMARQHARGKLTVQEKIACLFDPGTFAEDMAPSPGLDPRHGERRLLTGHGQMHGRQVAVAIFDSAIAAGSVTISTGVKLIKQIQLAEAQRCPLLISRPHYVHNDAEQDFLAGVQHAVRCTGPSSYVLGGERL